MNIYQHLGLRTYSDGSVSNEDRCEALKMLGFVPDESVKFYSFSELADYSALVPLYAEGYGVKCQIEPISNKPGKFRIQYGTIAGVTKYFINKIYSANDIHVALKDSKERMNELKSKMPKSKTENPYYDDRYTLKDDGWFYNDSPVTLYDIIFPDGTRYFIPGFNNEKT